MCQLFKRQLHPKNTFLREKTWEKVLASASHVILLYGGVSDMRQEMSFIFALRKTSQRKTLKPGWDPQQSSQCRVSFADTSEEKKTKQNKSQ